MSIALLSSGGRGTRFHKARGSYPAQGGMCCRRFPNRHTRYPVLLPGWDSVFEAEKQER